MNKEKRLKKEQKTIRGCYTVRIPDDVSFETAHDLLQHALDPFSPDEHTIRDGWVKR